MMIFFIEFLSVISKAKILVSLFRPFVTVHFSCLLGLAPYKLYLIFRLVEAHGCKGPIPFAEIFAVGHKKILLPTVTDEGDVLLILREIHL